MRAQELRASLGVRKDADAMLVEASKMRQEAAIAADAIVGEAQDLSSQLLGEASRSAARITTEAQQCAEELLARARSEAEEITARARVLAETTRAQSENDVEEHRRRVRAEVMAQVEREMAEAERAQRETSRNQSQAFVADLEASVRILGVSLETAIANVTELLGTLEGLRAAGATHADQAIRGTSALSSVRSPAQPEADPAAPPYAPVSMMPTASAAQDSVETFARSAPAVPDPAPIAEPRRWADPVDSEPNGVAGAGRPRSATEAFLSSSSLEVEQATRELQELRESDEARRRKGVENRRAAARRELEDGLADERDLDEAESARPLGWLFRSAQ
ncbi:hypothetical protein [Nocardioides sp.]|uniref:hypothetical protein n=1 Tax=Nocardioides sp. TaxID=35761 RepID=UPI003567FBB8